MESLIQLSLGSTAKNSSKGSGTSTQGPEMPILSVLLLQFERYSLVCSSRHGEVSVALANIMGVVKILNHHHHRSGPEHVVTSNK